MKKQRDHLSFQIDEIIKKKRRAGQDEELLGEVMALESKLSTLKEDLSAAVQGIESCDAELANLENQTSDIDQDWKTTMKSLEKMEAEMEELDGVIEKVEKQVFADFCRTIKIKHIRDYERSALKATQEASEKSLEFSNTKVKIESLYVLT